VTLLRADRNPGPITGNLTRTRVDGPVSTSSSASGIAVSGGVSRSRNATVPSPNVHGSPAVATCQREQAAGGRDRRGLGGRRRGRAIRTEGKPEEAGPVADQVQPPGAARGTGESWMTPRQAAVSPWPISNRAV